MSKNSKFMGPAGMSKEMFAQEQFDGLKNYLQGKILTIIDASFADSQQRKAVKDLVRDAFWSKEYYSESIISYFLDKPLPTTTAEEVLAEDLRRGSIGPIN